MLEHIKYGSSVMEVVVCVCGGRVWRIRFEFLRIGLGLGVECRLGLRLRFGPELASQPHHGMCHQPTHLVSPSQACACSRSMPM